jgi:endonuclease/exonuclease/phosphatase family metal-dependent hydrolase
MDRTANSENAPLAQLLTAALAMILGIQLMRSLLPYFQSLLIERLGWGTIQVGLFALAVFLFAFLAGPLNRFFGDGLMILVTGFTIGLSRFAAQFWIGDPIGKMIFTLTGVIAFILFLPTAVGFAVGSSSKTGGYLAVALLTGLVIDLALNGLFFTYDLIWQRGLWPSAIVTVLVLALWWSIFNLLRQGSEANTADTRFGQALSWAVIGPFLFLHLLTFSNIAWTTTSTGWSFPAAFFWLLMAYGLGFAIWLLPQSWRRVLLTLSWITVLVTGILIFMGRTESLVTAIYLLSGQIALSGALIAVLSYLGGAGSGEGLRNISISGGISMVFMVVLLFAYYAFYDLPLPFSNQILPLIAFLLIALFGIAGLLNSWKQTSEFNHSLLRIPAAVALLTLLIPITIWLTQRGPAIPENGNRPLRVMTYNIHFGANTEGQLDLEALAQVIEAEEPDVVGLQEVSRGWIINGSVDMLVWLANRLDMNLFFGPATDAQWGNSLLTRIPVIEQSYHALPTEELLLKRGFIHSRLVATGGHNIDLIVTHYHNPQDGGDIRELQSQAILDYIDGMAPSIMMGDLNAQHGMEEIDMLVKWGYGDVLNLTGVEPGYTNPVPDPFRRIDYIFITPDLEASAAVVPYSEASDHLPIAVDLSGGN